MKKRHQVVQDIRPIPLQTTSVLEKRKVSSWKSSFLGFTKKACFFLVLFIIPIFYFGSAVAPVTGEVVSHTGQIAQATTGDAPVSEAERETLEARLEELEREMAEYEKTISDYRRQGTSLKNEIGVLDAKMKQLDLKIRSINYSLQQLDNEIVSTTERIAQIEEDVLLNHERLSSMLRRMDEYDKEGLIEVLLANPRLSDFFGSVNDLFTVQDGVQHALTELKDLRVELTGQKEELVLERTDAATLKAYQAQQKQQVASIKSEKDELLDVTQGQEAAYQELLEETKKTAAEIRSRILNLAGGGELTFGEAYEFAKIASDATGIREAFILSILTQESGMNGVIGSNLGQCFYNEPRNNTDGAVMRKREQVVFIDLMAEIGRDPATTPVSCPIVSDGAYGGAMGPAQFMPTTWNLYKNRIASATGSNPPSPFNNLDAITATALYLEDAYGSSSCLQYKADACRDYGLCSAEESRTLLERCAAAKYYAGGRWYTYRWAYGEPVVERARQFQKDIDVLEGGK